MNVKYSATDMKPKRGHVRLTASDRIKNRFSLPESTADTSARHYMCQQAELDRLLLRESQPHSSPPFCQIRNTSPFPHEDTKQT